MVEVRTEVPEDYRVVRDVHVRAFGGGDAEARIVELLRDRRNAAVALVAIVDGQIVGHIVPGSPPGADGRQQKLDNLSAVGCRLRQAWITESVTSHQVAHWLYLR